MVTVLRKVFSLLFLLTALAMVPSTRVAALSPCDLPDLVCELDHGITAASFDCQPVVDCFDVAQCYFYVCPNMPPEAFWCEENMGIWNGPAGEASYC